MTRLSPDNEVPTNNSVLTLSPQTYLDQFSEEEIIAVKKRYAQHEAAFQEMLRVQEGIHIYSSLHLFLSVSFLVLLISSLDSIRQSRGLFNSVIAELRTARSVQDLIPSRAFSRTANLAVETSTSGDNNVGS